MRRGRRAATSIVRHPIWRSTVGGCKLVADRRKLIMGGRMLIADGRKLVVITAAALAALALLASAPAAQASEAQTIIEKCAHGEPFGGYSQNAYREALKQMPTEVIEYSPCVNLIRKAELAAAAGGGGATGTPGSGVSPNVPIPLTPSEQQAVQKAHHNGSAPVRVGNEPIRPGVVHADIASAVNTLPHSLFAVLAFLAAGALVLAIGEVRKHVRARRDG
jgi:hypothetical protein